MSETVAIVALTFTLIAACFVYIVVVTVDVVVRVVVDVELVVVTVCRVTTGGDKATLSIAGSPSVGG